MKRLFLLAFLGAYGKDLPCQIPPCKSLNCALRLLRKQPRPKLHKPVRKLRKLNWPGPAPLPPARKR